MNIYTFLQNGCIPFRAHFRPFLDDYSKRKSHIIIKVAFPKPIPAFF